MRRIILAAAMGLLAALGILGQTGPKVVGHQVLKCAGLDGKACTWMQVSDLSAAAVSDKGAHKALDTFGKLTLAGFDGTLKCERSDGDLCTADQVRSLNRIAQPLKLRVWYRFGGALDKR